MNSDAAYFEVLARQLQHNEIKLDELSDADLMLIYNQLNQHPRKNAAILFPAKVTGYINGAKLIKWYTSNYATFKVCERDENPSASTYLEICERIYEEMPNSVKRYVR